MKYNLQLTFSLLFFTSVCFAQNAVKSKIDEFAAKTGAIPTIDKATNSLSFLRFPAGKTMKITGATPEEKSLSFLKTNAALFDIQTTRDSYLVKENKKDNYGLEHVVVQQYYKGVPVFDGVLKFHFSKNYDLAALNGNRITVDKLSTTPAISKEEAAAIALKMVTGQKSGKFAAPLKAVRNTLYVFQKGLAQGYQGSKYLVYEVEVRNDADVREFLYIDAHTKALVEQFTGIHSIERKLYDKLYYPAAPSVNLLWKEGDAFDGLNTWQTSEIKSAGQIYNLMKNVFGHVSYDNHDATMITTNNNPNIDCPNANWNGVTANYCDNLASDDVVAHEWGHAYTEYTSELLYAWQAGALNEAYSDIWGETVDQINNYFDSGESDAKRTGCGSSNRWRIGEQATAFGGAIRDMWDPTCEGDPGKVTDTQYNCDPDYKDNGGVHFNSGILNHAYALLVDGGTYNGQIIKGLGFTKAAHIFWHAQSAYMSKTTDFAAQADILETSLQDLIGINLRSLSTSEDVPALSGEMITEEDAEELAKVLMAVELRSESDCGFLPFFQPVATLCSGGSAENAIFYEDFESGINGWTASDNGLTNTWETRNWVLQAAAPGGRSGHVVYGVNSLDGDCVSNFQNGSISFISPKIAIPATTSGPFSMAFDHYVSLETGWDGGNISYKINDGTWVLVPASAFTENGYNTLLKTAAQGSDNPLRGQPGFSGANGGSVVGSWGQSRIDLEALGLQAGETIQFRWDLGTDGCGGWDGWYIDDVRVYSCATPSVQFVTTSTTINEGEANISRPSPAECLKYVEKIVTVRINKAPVKPVTVNIRTSGTATRGITADYSITPATLTLEAGALSKDVKVRIYNDAYVEESESFTLAYTLENPDGGDAYPETINQEHTVIIEDDDMIPGTENKEVLSADFNTGLPTGWKVLNGGVYPDTWGVVISSNTALDPAGRPFLFINSDAAQMVAIDKTVESASFNTVGMSSINLSYLEFFSVYEGINDFDEKAIIDVWDGTEWHNLLTQTEKTGSSGSWDKPFARTISIPVKHANAAMKVRFRYVAYWDFWWAIDNVKISGGIPTQVESTVTATPDEQYLGPNATAYFYDPAPGNVMAKIKNLSDHDYGCTAVAIDRAGEDETDWVLTYHITNKTFKVTPTNNNPNGKYEITLYYKASELPHFNGNHITSMGKSEGGIGAGNVASSSFAEVQVSSAFNTDYAYTATFDSGFSGFGLSDAPPVGPLPVTLTKFEGKHTAEGNALNWETTAEVNSDYFVVEHSVNAKNFTEISRISSAGNAVVLNTYKFTDTHFAKGLNYYRLKQVDRDGKFAYSRIVVIDALNTKELIHFPNPVQSLLSIKLPDADMKLVNMKIINSTGQIVMSREKVKTVNGTLSQDMNKLPAGMYIVVISDEKSSYSFSVAKL